MNERDNYIDSNVSNNSDNESRNSVIAYYVLQITVIATDYGTPSLSTSIKITIDVLDDNDHIPIVTSATNETIRCSYLTPVSTSISNVKAFDPDAGDNGKLGYFIQSGER